MTKGKAKMEMSDILTKLEYKDITFCEAGVEIAKVLDIIYSGLCPDTCEEEDPCAPSCI